jgi:hypothetical protein
MPVTGRRALLGLRVDEQAADRHAGGARRQVPSGEVDDRERPQPDPGDQDGEHRQLRAREQRLGLGVRLADVAPRDRVAGSSRRSGRRA